MESQPQNPEFRNNPENIWVKQIGIHNNVMVWLSEQMES